MRATPRYDARRRRLSALDVAAREFENFVRAILLRYDYHGPSMTWLNARSRRYISACARYLHGLPPARCCLSERRFPAEIAFAVAYTPREAT